ncbi:MAG: phage holin family protein, partial [Verrucomicrobiota bacterium]
AIIGNRTKLAALELKEEGSRALSAAVWGGVFLLTAGMAIISLACTFLFLFWKQKTFVGLGLLVFCMGAGIAGFLYLRKGIKSPTLFGESISQFKKDRFSLKARSSAGRN